MEKANEKAVLILADLHLHTRPKWRFEWNTDFLDSLLKRDQFGDLILLGDALEIRDKVDSRVVNQFLHFVLSWQSGDVYILSGQHDSYLPGRSTFEALDDRVLFGLHGNRAHVIDREAKEFSVGGSFVWFVPFAREAEDYRAMLKRVPDGATVFTHLPVREVVEEFGVSDLGLISCGEFDRFGKVISGDIHKSSKFGKVEYVGAVSQRDWRDKSADGCIGIYVDGELRRESTMCPVHVEVSGVDELSKLVEVLKDRKCVVRAAAGLDVSGDNILEAQEIIKTDVESVDIKFKGGQSDEELLREYMCSNKLGLDKQDSYLNVGKELLGGVSDAS